MNTVPDARPVVPRSIFAREAKKNITKTERITFITRSFETAKWIWYETPCANIVNAYIQARRVFTVARVPAKAFLCITADSSYRLFVNGRRVCQGPARGFQHVWPFDRVDIAPYVRKGKNVVAVLAHCLGVYNAKYLHTGWAGLIAEGTVADESIATGPTWKVRRSPGHLRTLARLSALTDFQEHFDARQDDSNWTRADYDDSAWSAPLCCFQPYVDPWPDFSERDLPLLKEENFPARSVVAEGFSRAGHADENVVIAYLDANPKWKPVCRKLKINGDYGEINVPGMPKNRVSLYCLDFGHEVVGHSQLEIHGGRGGEVLDLLMSEIVRADGVPCINDPRPDVNAMSLGHRLILRKGVTRHEVYFYTGFRYLVLAVRNHPQSLRIRVAIRNISYPLDLRASFDSSDVLLNRIYQTSKLSLKCCMQDALVDGPQREQSQWWGHRCAMNPALYLLGDYRIEARALRQIGMQTGRNGLVYSVAPSLLHNWILPELNCIWIVNLWDHYAWTGDLTVFRDVVSSVESALACMADDARRHRGLVAVDIKRYFHRLFIYDTGLYNRVPAATYSATHNLLYLRALRAASMLFRACGRTGDTLRYEKDARHLERAILLHFGAKQRPYFNEVLSDRFKPIPMAAPEHNIYMLTEVLLNDLKPVHRREVAEDLWQALNRVGMKFHPAPGLLYDSVQALFQAGYRHELIEYIARYWKPWLDDCGMTTFPEHWCFNAKPEELVADSGSGCHSWASYPIEFFARIVLGIERTAVAWHRMRFAPDFATVAFARGCVPTPLGLIEASWKRHDNTAMCSLTVPKGVLAMIDLPGFRKTRQGPFVWNFRSPCNKQILKTIGH